MIEMAAKWMLIAFLVSLPASAAILAEPEVAGWQVADAPDGIPEGVTVALVAEVGPDGDPGLAVTCTQDEPTDVFLFKVQPGAMDNTVIKYRAMLRSKDVAGKAYLAMECQLPDGGRYFSRAVDQALTGTASWRQVSTPFHLNAGQQPEAVYLGIRFEGTGTVTLSRPRLSRGDGAAQPPGWGLTMDSRGLRLAKGKAAGANRAGIVLGLVGGIFGTLAGIWGALAGILCPRGIGRRFVIGTGIGFLVASIALDIAGLATLWSGAPYGVWYALLLSGGIGTVLFAALLPVVARRYRDAEAARMAALDHAEGL